MKLTYSIPSFLVAFLISLTVHLDPLFAQADFYRGKPSRLFKAEIREGQEICG